MVSVVIVVYNGEKYIDDAIQSVLNQTYKDIELIVADDGSTDGTKEAVKKYKNVKYIYQENKGEGSARNLGIENSKGEYLAFLDADDLYSSDKIEKQLKILVENDNIDIVYNDLKVVDEQLNYISTLKSEGIYEKREDLLAHIIYRQVIQGPICMMMRRKCIEGIKWSEDLIYTVDYEYIIKLAFKYNFKYLEEPLYIYRRHGNNLSNKHNATVEEEIHIIKGLGIKCINEVVNSSTLSNYDKMLLLSKIYIKIREYEEARKILEDIMIEKEDNIIYFYLGLCYQKLNHIYKAKECYENAINLDEEMAEAYNNLGCCIYNADKESSKTYFQKALSLRSNYIDAQNNIQALVKNDINFKVTERELRKVLTLYS